MMPNCFIDLFKLFSISIEITWKNVIYLCNLYKSQKVRCKRVVSDVKVYYFKIIQSVTECKNFIFYMPQVSGKISSCGQTNRWTKGSMSPVYDLVTYKHRACVFFLKCKFLPLLWRHFCSEWVFKPRTYFVSVRNFCHYSIPCYRYLEKCKWHHGISLYYTELTNQWHHQKSV